MPKLETIPLPPLDEIGQALRRTTQRLACELAAPTSTAPDWSAFEWRAAMAVAAMHGVSALLANRLRWRGPACWDGFLAEQLRQGMLRQQRIETLLTRLDGAAADAGLAAVALKGSALLRLGLYRQGERPMGDIDLLVRSEDADGAARVLATLGYAKGILSWRHQAFVPPSTPATVGFGEHADNPLKIELHTRIMERMPRRCVEITAQQFPRSARAGLNPYPSNVALMRHLLLHSAGNMRDHGVRLIQLHDVVLLAGRLARADWEELLDACPEPRGLWWALPPLTLIERYFPGVIPPFVRERLRRGCPLLLRRSARQQQLADVSLSKIRITAFPGWEWSRSPGEALSFFASRLLPDRESCSLMRQESVTQPSLVNSDWTNRPQLEKILRWVFTRPPRVQTMYSVRRALAYRPS